MTHKPQKVPNGQLSPHAHAVGLPRPAEKEATIAKVNAAEGESLAVDAVILELE